LKNEDLQEKCNQLWKDFIGCIEHCPLCRKKCDVVHKEHEGVNDEKHGCNGGH
jgi:hypothetical protein